MEFEVPFVAGKQRPRVTAHGTYTPRSTREAEAAVRAAFLAAAGPFEAPLFGGAPVALTVDVRRHLPKSRPRRVVSEPDTFKPDADNVCKLVADALNGVAWADDSQVVRLWCRKFDRRRGEDDRTTVRIEEVADERLF